MSAGAQIAALGALAAVLVALAVWAVLRVRGNPERRERKRRLHVHRRGRLGDATITEANQDIIYYSYSVRGVQYTASQEVGSLRDCLPSEPERLVGIATLKYATNNPANSILLCEEWSGLRAPTPLDSN